MLREVRTSVGGGWNGRETFREELRNPGSCGSRGMDAVA